MEKYDKLKAEEENKREGRELVKELPTGLLRWYHFERGARALYVGADEDAMAGMLREDKGLALEIVEAEDLLDLKEQNGFDYIICSARIEKLKDIEGTLRVLKAALKSGGVMLLGMNNRLGLRYFIGDRDPYTQRNFDGIEDYWRAYNKNEDTFKGRMYSRDELERMLKKAGFDSMKVYSVLPDLSDPSLIYAEGFLPNEDISTRLFPVYNSKETLFLDEVPLYRTIIGNGLFHKMANAYLIECAPKEKLSDVLHVTSSTERGKKDALITVIHDNDTVTKEAAYPEGRERLESLMENSERLKARGIKTVELSLENGVLTMPFVKGDNGQLYLKKLLLKDKDRFLEALDHFRDIVMKSSDIHEGVYEPEPLPDPEEEIKRKKRAHMDGEDLPVSLFDEAMFDLVPLNSFFVDGDFVFYDQEFCIRNYPVNTIVMRMILTFYTGNSDLSRILPMDELLQRYGLLKERERWQRPEGEFLGKLRNFSPLFEHHKKVWPDSGIINANRQRMNFSADDYQRLFIDIFEYADTRKLIIFGSGLFAKHFVSLYSKDYPVFAVVDNNEKKWGQEIEGLPGIKIQPPSFFEKLKHGEYKVLICIKNYLSVMNQLEEMGINEYSVFDMNRAYPRKRHPIPVPDEGKKKYHVGYIAGVFDLYHIGHLNMFRRAKEMCDYLIVGVVTDEGVKRFKGTDPFVPFEERIEMVSSCRYVDEAVEIPLMFADTKRAWELHHFDVQFSGSDYVDDPGWLSQKEFLEKHGATLEFFPYTQQTSSTKLKRLIEERLL